MRVVTSQEMKQIEQHSLDFGLSFHRLMENAGSAAAAFIKRTFKVVQRNCVVFCGAGNNGGDGFVVARKLFESDVNVIAVLLSGKPDAGEALAMYKQLSDLGVPVYEFAQVADKLSGWLAQTDLVVDAICGTGFEGQLRPEHARACEMINACTAAIICLDIPTGVECDSGKACQNALRADYTLAFDSLKPCHISPECIPYCGKVQTLDIGIPEEARTRVSPTLSLDELTESRVFELIPPRKDDSHKGSYGRVLNIAGSARYRGAAVLSTLGALRCGAGVVTLASTEMVCAGAAMRIPEATFLPLSGNDLGNINPAHSLSSLLDALESANAVAFGCGLENNHNTSQLLEHLLKHATCPIVLDADGINALGGNIHLLKQAKVPLILTPHPGEMARLLGLTTAEVARCREGLAIDFARSHGVWLLLKGKGTVIACPDGKTWRNPTGNSGLAKGGSGDVLTGMIAALLAGGMPPGYAAACAAFLHGLAAQRTAARLSQTAMLPSELLDDLCAIFLKHGR